MNMELRSLSLILSLIFILTTQANAQPSFLYNFCLNDKGNYTNSSDYKVNLNTLLTKFSTANGNGYGFYNLSSGQGNNEAYAIGLCRGDMGPEVCQTCLQNATLALPQVCPNQQEAVGWYDPCMLRYSNRSLVGRWQNSQIFFMRNLNNVSDPDADAFSRGLKGLLDGLKNRATSGGSLRKFATGNTTGPGFLTIYALVQCTPDLSKLDCNNCLDDTFSYIRECCDRKIGGRVIGPSCNFRYETYLFYQPTEDAPLQASPPLSPPRVSLGPPSPRTNSTSPQGNGNISPSIVVSISLSIATVLLLMGIGFIWLRRREMKRKKIASLYNAVPDDQNGNESITTEESLQYDLETIQNATNNFSDDNKLGEGGFGTVYKGVLSNGEEIAVKRLSSTSLQGVGEFKNEVLLVAKLQHRNLTRLIGFCLEGVEKLLVYEFVPNNSLDKFLFDQPEEHAPLDWVRRYKVIGGIARGILYLHEDSRLRVIHRDLKASNILLDEQLNPKISDFGMAKICGVDQTQGNTSRIVGTFGYMSPEYAFYGQFSVKSDVFSFGVLVIEIVTGKKGTRFLGSDSETEDLLSYTWKQWRDGTALELIDPRIRDSYSANEVVRCIHIGLLCVQESPDDRPTMATIVLMLSSYSVSLPLPKQPAFFPHTRTEGTLPKTDLDSDKSSTKSFTINEMSITETYPR